MNADSLLGTGIVKITEYISYDRDTCLGKGSSGRVFKGFHFQKEGTIAVKIISVKDANEESVLRQSELMFNASTHPHPNVVDFYGWDLRDSCIYFYLEHCKGGSLKDRMKEQVEEIQAVSYFKQLLEGLVFLRKKLSTRALM